MRSLKGALRPFFMTVGLWLLAAFWHVGYALDVHFSQAYLDQIGKKYGNYSERRLIGWEKLVETNQNKTEREKLEAVNTYMNLLTYETNSALWGKPDYWATPLETLVAGAADCKGYSIAKYFTLLTLGVPDSKLLITYVKAIQLNQAHMVLTYYATPSSIPLVLDNINGQILPADQRTDLLPIYSFNGTGLWQAKELGLGHKVGNPNDLKQWSDLQSRMTSGAIAHFYNAD